jgi:hypothetical protein
MFHVGSHRFTNIFGRLIVIVKNEMGGACSAYGGEERCVQGFGGET